MVSAGGPRVPGPGQAGLAAPRDVGDPIPPRGVPPAADVVGERRRAPGRRGSVGGRGRGRPVGPGSIGPARRGGEAPAGDGVCACVCAPVCVGLVWISI